MDFSSILVFSSVIISGFTLFFHFVLFLNYELVSFILSLKFLLVCELLLLLLLLFDFCKSGRRESDERVAYTRIVLVCACACWVHGETDVCAFSLAIGDSSLVVDTYEYGKKNKK